MDMNDKQKQIEEMALIISGSNELDTIRYYRARIKAKDLYNAGYRKIPEGSIVQILKKVEFAGKGYDIQEMSMARSTYDAVLNQARKQAIKEFAKRLKEEKQLIDLGCGAGCYDYIDIDDIDEIAKEFGVEL